MRHKSFYIYWGIAAFLGFTGLFYTLGLLAVRGGLC